MDSFQELVYKQLQKKLAALQEMTPIAPGDATLDWNAYKAKLSHYERLYDDALSMALYALPDEVQALLRAIDERQRVLLGVGKSKAEEKPE